MCESNQLNYQIMETAMTNVSMKINFFEKNGHMDTESIGAGVYLVELSRVDYPLIEPLPLYIGQSVYMAKRCGEHLYEFIKRPEYFELKPDDLANDMLILNFKVLQPFSDNISVKLYEKEKELIIELKPRTQSCSSDRQIKEKLDIVQNEMKQLWHG
jgi:hypothetical protein